MWEGLGLVSDWKSNVSVLYHKVSFTSRPIYIFIMFALTLERVQFYIRFIQFIKHFPYAWSLKAIVSTFYLLNEIRITTHLTSIFNKFFTLLFFIFFIVYIEKRNYSSVGQKWPKYWWRNILTTPKTKVGSAKSKMAAYTHEMCIYQLPH